MPFLDRSPLLEMDDHGWPLTIMEDMVYTPPQGIWPLSVIVPKGFKTDLASVPRIFWRAFPPFGEYSQAAIVHDYLYNTPMTGVSREIADAIFLAAMVELGVSWFDRQVIHKGVRVGGWATWNNVRKVK